MRKLREEKLSTKLALMFKRATLSFDVEERFRGKCWLEIQKLKKIEAEEAHCLNEKNKIWSEFKASGCCRICVAVSIEDPFMD